MRPRSLIAASVLGLVASAGLVSSTASGDPGSGTTPYPIPPIDSTLDGPLRASADGIKLKIDDDATVRNFVLTYGPGAFSGCHEHPGIVLAVVLEGAVERRVPHRRPETFVAGQAFTEVGPHFVKNVNTSTTRTVGQAADHPDRAEGYDRPFRQGTSGADLPPASAFLTPLIVL